VELLLFLIERGNYFVHEKIIHMYVLSCNKQYVTLVKQEDLNLYIYNFMSF
jgi:hypothetical protein